MKLTGKLNPVVPVAKMTIHKNLAGSPDSGAHPLKFPAAGIGRDGTGGLPAAPLPVLPHQDIVVNEYDGLKHRKNPFRVLKGLYAEIMPTKKAA